MQPAPSPVLKKSIDEDINAQNIEGTSAEVATMEQNQTIKPEKLSLEEGFCCVSLIAGNVSKFCHKVVDSGTQWKVKFSLKFALNELKHS